MQAANIARGPVRRRRGLASMLLLWLLAASGYAYAASYAGEPIAQPATNCESSTAPQAAVRTGAWYPEVKVCRDSDTVWIIVARRRGGERTATESTHFSVGQGGSVTGLVWRPSWWMHLIGSMSSSPMEARAFRIRMSFDLSGETTLGGSPDGIFRPWLDAPMALSTRLPVIPSTI